MRRRKLLPGIDCSRVPANTIVGVGHPSNLDGAGEAARHAASLSNEIEGFRRIVRRSRRTISVRCDHPLRVVVLVLKFRRSMG